MARFTDSIRIIVRAGKGGAGAVSFFREKYLPKGGPDGGDGGKGGDVYIEARNSYHNLSHFFRDRVYKAENGRQGMGANRNGKTGADLVLRVPPGTEIIDEETSEVLFDLTEEGEPVAVALGGMGGKGNAFFKSSTNQTPRYAQPGMPGEERALCLNLKLIADVGLVGLPNAGKSTLLSRLTNAKPKIADYPFTTLIPNLGVIQRADGSSIRIADIPGIIEGAHRGLGLGLSFLRHIERVRAILFLVDINDDDPAYALRLLRSELETYNPALTLRPSAVLLSKADLGGEGVEVRVGSLLPGERLMPISSLTGLNLDRVVELIEELMG
ncbi:MAG TPA: GTPase ObgE [Spirochaetota bacterium]|nr:GTPase ObgE [Spirochaetota bacterium]